MLTIRKAIMLAALLSQVPTDQQLDCPALFAEITGNNAKMVSLTAEESNKRGQNIAMGVVGAILFWPALFAMDFKDAAGTDKKAVEARLAYLNSLYGAKQCAGVTGPTPVVPAPVPVSTPDIKSPADNGKSTSG